VNALAGSKNVTLGNISFSIGKRNGRCVLERVTVSAFFNTGPKIFLIVFLQNSFLKINLPDSTRSTSGEAFSLITLILFGTFFLIYRCNPLLSTTVFVAVITLVQVLVFLEVFFIGGNTPITLVYFVIFSNMNGVFEQII